jgi:hypothetical protein
MMTEEALGKGRVGGAGKAGFVLVEGRWSRRKRTDDTPPPLLPVVLPRGAIVGGRISRDAIDIPCRCN